MKRIAVTVRRFEESEWRMYRDLRLHALADSPDSFGSTYEREAVQSDVEWASRLRAGASDDNQMPVVALVDSLPVGLAWGRRHEHEPAVAHLFQVWVAPTHRRQGIGHLLTEAIIEWARDLGVRTVRLGVTPSHPAAVQLYERVGFVNAGESQPLRPGSHVRSQPMELTL
jgi:ribosomal protein S18 acetylase RimI-like enzyme